MNFIILIAVGVFGVWIGSYLSKKQKQRRLRGLEKFNQTRNQHKEKAKKRILGLIKEKERVTNDDVQNLLKVSDATATRYLDSLEKENKIIQKGETSQIYYRFK